MAAEIRAQNYKDSSLSFAVVNRALPSTEELKVDTLSDLLERRVEGILAENSVTLTPKELHWLHETGGVENDTWLVRIMVEGNAAIYDTDPDWLNIPVREYA